MFRKLLSQKKIEAEACLVFWHCEPDLCSVFLRCFQNCGRHFVAPKLQDVTVGLMAIKENSSMIQTCPACGAAIDTTDAEPLARVVCPKCGEKMRVERTFDHFVLVETLGIGGMGTV